MKRYLFALGLVVALTGCATLAAVDDWLSRVEVKQGPRDPNWEIKEQLRRMEQQAQENEARRQQDDANRRAYDEWRRQQERRR